jgi:hypothetical protein
VWSSPALTARAPRLFPTVDAYRERDAPDHDEGNGAADRALIDARTKSPAPRAITSGATG